MKKIIEILISFFLPALLMAQEVPVSPEASIVANIVNLTQNANAQSLVVTQLKRGDRVKILGSESDFVKIEYQLEGEYPLTGFVPKEALSPDALAALPTQNYRAEEVESPVTTEVQKLPETPLTEKVDTPRIPKLQEIEKLAQAKVRKPRPAREWPLYLNFDMGYASWDETLKAKNGSSYGAPFLKYELTGVEMNAGIRMERKFSSFTGGGFLRYQFDYFSQTIPSTNGTISSGSVQAQLHEIKIGPLLRTSYSPTPRWTIEPEIRVAAGYHLFTTNQLQSVTGSKPVFMSHTAIVANAEFEPSVRGPWGITAKPLVGVWVPLSLSETPIVTKDSNGNALGESDQTRTGDPQTGNLNLQYGGSLEYDLSEIDLPGWTCTLSFYIKDYSRKYSGLGNRANVAMNDTKAETKLMSASAGIRYDF